MINKKYIAYLYVVPLVLLFAGQLIYSMLISFLVSAWLFIFRNSMTSGKKSESNWHALQKKGKKAELGDPGAGTLSLIDRIKSRLSLDFVNLSFRKADSKNIIGGFMIPILPFFAKIKYKDKMKLVEATIHELCHIWYFIYGFQVFFFFAIIWLMDILQLNLWYRIPILLVFLLYQEVIAFKKTSIIAKEFGYETKPLGKKTFIKYILLYSAVFYSFAVIFLEIGWLSFKYVTQVLWWIIPLAVFLFLVKFVFNKAFYYIFKGVDWVIDFGTNKRRAK